MQHFFILKTSSCGETMVMEIELSYPYEQKNCARGCSISSIPSHVCPPLARAAGNAQSSCVQVNPTCASTSVEWITAILFIKTGMFKEHQKAWHQIQMLLQKGSHDLQGCEASVAWVATWRSFFFWLLAVKSLVDPSRQLDLTDGDLLLLWPLAA